MHDQDFLSELLNTPSPTGGEQPGQVVWARRIGAHSDQVEKDAYGNTWATMDGSSNDGPRLMLEAHADEIGFMVRYVSDDGFLYLTPVGGSDVAITRGKRIRLLGDRGEVCGVIANTAIHLRKDTSGDEKAPKWHEIHVDLGASKREEVEALGLRVGHFAVYSQEPVLLQNGRLSARAIDNRISGYILARVFEELRKVTDRSPATVLAVNAVQEEVGGNGATMISYRLSPDVALVFDVTHATDTPGLDPKKVGMVKLGGGPSLTHGTANHPALVKRLMEVAAREGIQIQHEASSRFTGTDTDNVFVSKSGIPSALISIPLRYMHSPVELVDMADVESTVRLVVAFIRDLKAGEHFEVG
ncbi:MAG: M42 family metallopeptidase [Opitutales bacterium]|nr:M42 family metallopeptidase [Opitutales bacterium]